MVKFVVLNVVQRYGERLPVLGQMMNELDRWGDPASLVSRLMQLVQAGGRKLFVLIDEYDNFTNRLLSDGAQDLYEIIATRTGFVRSFYSALKAGASSGAVSRIFITGVSPLLLDDVSSGFNIATHVSQDVGFNALAGFTRAEVEVAVDAFHLAVLTLIRETLRVERAALEAAIGHAERRRRIDIAKLAAQLDEYSQLIAAYADLQRAERAGCGARPLIEAQAQDGCRDETTRMLLAYSNAWTLGRAGQQQADVLELGVHHEASIDRSRAAMAVREVYLAAGVAELAKFNHGGIRPEALAQIIVSAVGFGVVAGGVY